MGPGLSPDRGCTLTRAETSTLGQYRFLRTEPAYHLGQARAIPIEDKMIIQALQRTAATVIDLPRREVGAVAAYGLSGNNRWRWQPRPLRLGVRPRRQSVHRELEVRTGVRIDAALDRIRCKVSLMGTAGRWHFGKGSDILQSPDLLGRYVELPNEHEEAKYLAQLSALVAEATEQDRRCAECWDTGSKSEATSQYLVERDALIQLFPRFRFRPKMYERLVRQSDKPVLSNAIQFLAGGQECTPEAMALERVLRTRLREFVKLEEGIKDDLCELDETRKELITAHMELALNMARSQPRLDESAVSSALVGLQRAASWYDYKRGYSFEEYAQHWVQEAIDKRRT